MDDGTTVDNLEIEVEASSAEAEKKVDALCQALERLKKATGRFGNVSDRIRGIGDAAGQSTATAKTQQKRAALERADQMEGMVTPRQYRERPTEGVATGKGAVYSRSLFAYSVPGADG